MRYASMSCYKYVCGPIPTINFNRYCAIENHFIMDNPPMSYPEEDVENQPLRQSTTIKALRDSYVL